MYAIKSLLRKIYFEITLLSSGTNTCLILVLSFFVQGPHSIPKPFFSLTGHTAYILQTSCSGELA